MNRLGILSGCDHDRTFAAANHQYYADQQGLCYVNDIAPMQHGGFNYKLDKVAKFLGHNLFEYMFWLDDDAFFMQPDQPLDRFIDEYPDSDLIFCESPVNQHQGRAIQTYISSGNFFVRNTERARAFVQASLETPREEIENWWEEPKHGFLSGGDQDAMVYLLHEDERFNDPDFHARLPYQAFNARPFHFDNSADEHFLVHFTGKDKQAQIAAFAGRFSLSPALIPEEVFASMHGLREPRLLAETFEA
jgi:hypothetical protein